MESILTDIKKLLNVPVEDTTFDQEIVLHVNGALMAVNQLGIGPEGFAITGVTETWTDLLGTSLKLEAVKVLIYMKVRLIFDPPPNAFIVESFKNSITEMENRLIYQVERSPDV